jgi:translation initiation factor 1 (eIF-1/SUI1)
MNSTPYLKPDDINRDLNNLEKNIDVANWKESQIDIKEIKSNFRRTVSLIQFFVEKDDINNLTNNLARLESSIKSKNKSSALLEVGEARQRWDTIGE